MKYPPIKNTVIERIAYRWSPESQETSPKVSGPSMVDVFSNKLKNPKNSVFLSSGVKIPIKLLANAWVEPRKNPANPPITIKVVLSLQKKTETVITVQHINVKARVFLVPRISAM